MVSSSSCSAHSRMPLRIGHREMKCRSVLPFQANPPLTPLKRYSSLVVNLSSNSCPVAGRIRKVLRDAAVVWRVLLGLPRRRGAPGRARSRAVRGLRRVRLREFGSTGREFGVRLRQRGLAVPRHVRNDRSRCLRSQRRGSCQSCRRCLVVRPPLLRCHPLLRSLLVHSLPDLLRRLQSSSPPTVFQEFPEQPPQPP